MTTLTAEPQTEVTFVAVHCKEQVLTRVPARPVSDGMGGSRVVTEAEYLAQQEAANRQRVARGEDPLEYDKSPWHVHFEGGLFKTSDPVLIDWMRSHKFFRHNGASGFYELEVAPEQREPTTAQQMREVQQSLLHHDLERAEAVLGVEQETHRRPDVLEAAGVAVSELKDLLGADSTSDAEPKNRGSKSTSSS